MIALSGVGLNAIAGWWWADPVAALGMTCSWYEKGGTAWRGDGCCDRATRLLSP